MQNGVLKALKQPSVLSVLCAWLWRGPAGQSFLGKVTILNCPQGVGHMPGHQAEVSDPAWRLGRNSIWGVSAAAAAAQESMSEPWRLSSGGMRGGTDLGLPGCSQGAGMG
jgi:hypothetical protein